MSFSRHSRYLIFLVPALVFFCTLPGFSQNTTVVWSDPVLVSDSSQNAASPRIELNAAGEPLVLWGGGGSTAPAIRLARWQNGNFLPAQTLGTGNIASDLYGFDELDLATRGDTVFVAFENVEQGIYLLRATDGGLSFSGPTTVFTPAGGRIVTLPAVVADAAGNPLVSYLYELSSWSNAQFHLARSTDGGLSFETPVIASAPADGDFVCECCASDIVTRGDSVWLAFRNLRAGNVRDIWVTSSADGGALFDQAIDVDDTDWVQTICPSSAPRLLVGPDSLVSVWMSRGSGKTRVHGSTAGRSDILAGPSFTFAFTGPAGTQNRPDIAGNADTLGVVWEESGIPGTGTDLMFAFSTSGGSALPARIVNLTAAAGTQKNPALAYRTGVFHLVYADVLTNRLWYRRGVVTQESSAAGEAPGAKKGFECYPNPAHDRLWLRWDESFGAERPVQLSNSAGQICRSWAAVRSGQALPLQGLPAGWYFVRCTDDNFVEKVWVQKP